MRVTPKYFVEGLGDEILYPKVVSRRKVGHSIFRVAEVPKKMEFGVIGLNAQAAEELGIVTNIPQDVVVVWSGQSDEVKGRTVWHEGIESYCMSKGGLPYRIAHKIALKFENTNITPRQALSWYKKSKKSLGRAWQED